MSSLAYAAGQAESATPLLNPLFSHYSGPPFAIRFWDSTQWSSSELTPAFTLVLHTPTAWHTLSHTPDELALAEHYIDGHIDVEGDLYLALRAIPQIESSIRSADMTSVPLRVYTAAIAGRMERFLHAGNQHSQKRDAAAIAYHYDKPPAFYELFLGPTMVYSCAYFRSPGNTLETAQRDKMDHICRKLALVPGERFLDIGCGWGSLTLHAAAQYGAAAHGVSLSQSQVEYARQRIAAAGQSANCNIYWSDFRDLDQVHTPFNKIASVGMVEHVGLKQIDAYFREAYQLLVPNGLFLNHGITRRAGTHRGGPSFIDRYVFPDGELLTLTEMIRAAEDAGFEVRDVEDLREHYEETLHRWVANLVAHRDEAIALTDTRTFRIWQLYMAGSAEAFRRGDIAVHQLLLSKNDQGHSAAARTRDPWYSTNGTH
ncbi:MAG TPA: cyclopropane-fatty-acyl-phospholipid synthase family protein [Candidatus Aquilonibacter sp.]|nr:cyclopropane-fatty-acyl-phospholipid synthase family protein [Candidatus Aquilonibacter sp.]